ncbi:T9SS type A sorting domain-containing protein [Aureisphaera galaxeae]|uniref:T9SS type A sorting domain-containing protein n=1 Tax=Aureisphaera galaxeae TaxID=1538023 RepID=UPI00234FE431|nr:T9SS type A sorting domain-containing protein [Aureisphaera galaxeae]MDC8004651.1 T9SS type A sorting domain-containing protein [Aureisphaera galaxeae]
MMKTFTLFGALLFCMGTFSIAQTESNLDELLSRLDQNHRGSITDVFTSEEIAQLDNYFEDKRPQNQTYLGGGVELFAPENVNENFGHYNTGDPGTFNPLGSGGTADFEGAGAYNPVNGTYFVIDDAGNAYEVNPDTGIYTFLGTVTAPNGENFTGLEFNPLDNMMYGISTDGSGSTSISTINTTTLAVEEKGGTGLTLGIALGIDNAGVGFAYDIDTDFMFRINLSNGNATSLGAIGFDSSFGQGMGFDSTNGILYMSAFNNDTFQSELREVDPVTGWTTFIGAIGADSPGGTLQFAWTGPTKPPLSVEDNTFANFQMYPNPTNTTLTISALYSIDEVEVYTISGQKLIHNNIGDSRGSLSVSHLSTGVYILTVTIDGEKASYRFMKN